jgi:hypothetical protein
MSNNATTTFRLQSFGTSSAFDPHIIDYSRYGAENEDATGEPFSFADIPIPANGPTFIVEDDRRVYFFAIKFDKLNTTQVSQVAFPIRSLGVAGPPNPLTLTGEVAFYTRTTASTPVTMNAIPVTGWSPIQFTLTSADANNDYIVFNFSPITLPPAGDTPDTPIYLGLKLKNASGVDQLIFSAAYVGNDNYNSFVLNDNYPSVDSLQGQYSNAQITGLATTPIIYLQ